MVVHRAEPDYYNAVTTPMDLSMIQQKLKNEEYDDVNQMSDDICLIVSNAKAVYGVSITHPLITVRPPICGRWACRPACLMFDVALVAVTEQHRQATRLAGRLLI